MLSSFVELTSAARGSARAAAARVPVARPERQGSHPARSRIPRSRRNLPAGRNTNSRSRNRGCGTTSPGSSTTRSPYRIRSRSRVRGAHRLRPSPPAHRLDRAGAPPAGPAVRCVSPTAARSDTMAATRPRPALFPATTTPASRPAPCATAPPRSPGGPGDRPTLLPAPWRRGAGARVTRRGTPPSRTPASAFRRSPPVSGRPSMSSRPPSAWSEEAGCSSGLAEDQPEHERGAGRASPRRAVRARSSTNA